MNNDYTETKSRLLRRGNRDRNYPFCGHHNMLSEIIGNPRGFKIFAAKFDMMPLLMTQNSSSIIVQSFVKTFQNTTMPPCCTTFYLVVIRTIAGLLIVRDPRP